MGLISLVYNGQLGKYGGDTAISVYAVVSSVMTFVIMPASGISQGIQPILGNNYGAGNHHAGSGIYHAGDHLFSVPGKTIHGNQRNLLGTADQ